MKQKYFFLCLGLLFLSSLFSQNDYQVSQIPYQTYSVNGVPVAANDDMFSNFISLGFDFTFFGNTYNQILISTNGYIAFEGTAGGFSAWSFNTTIPNTGFPAKNTILACFHDLDNRSNIGQITYSIIGTAPYRKMVVIFTNQPHFSCTTLQSTFQMIMYETYNMIDVQLVNKPLCATWNSGRTVVGIINTDGTIGFAPTGRNTGAWAAAQEGYRFKLPFDSNVYYYTICDDDTDGLGLFNLAVAQNDINATNSSSVLFFETYADAENNTNPLSDLNYANTQSQQTIYAFSEGVIYDVKLQVIDCSNDFDTDSVPTSSEDLNGDGNLANDDTDNDGIPNFADNDDDGDTVLTEYEYVFARSNRGITSSLLDTDNDTVPDYLDDDDDGDGVLTKDEDYNHNFNPMDDDINTNSIPDYLDNAAVLGTTNFENNIGFTLYPNPAFSEITIANNNGVAINEATIVSINGQVLQKMSTTETVLKMDVSELQSGIYFVKLNTNEGIVIQKFLKN